jgi:hypothetical protein
MHQAPRQRPNPVEEFDCLSSLFGINGSKPLQQLKV